MLAIHLSNILLFMCSIWNRTSNPESLIDISICPLPIGIAVTRDPMSGKLLGYEEV